MADYTEYNRDMQYTLSSKLFFLPHVPTEKINLIADFGCADGALLKIAGKVMPTALLVGVDNDPVQRQAARENLTIEYLMRTSLVPSLEGLLPFGAPPHARSLLVMTSVMHEVMSFGEKSLQNWWNGMEWYGFNYIAIRDFSVPPWARDIQTPKPWLDAVKANDIYAWQLNDFELRWGRCTNLYNFMHFLLKRPFLKNWEREMQENYLFADTRTLTETVTQSGRYGIKHMRLGRSKVFERKTIKDLGFLPPVTTNIELVLVRKDTMELERKTKQYLAEAS